MTGLLDLDRTRAGRRCRRCCTPRAPARPPRWRTPRVAELAAVLAAKVGGAALLDELTAGLGLEAFVLFSSISATWGSGLQPAYAAANAFLDALAVSRRARGLAGTSVAWGLWGGGGMADGGARRRSSQRRGRAADGSGAGGPGAGAGARRRGTRGDGRGRGLGAVRPVIHRAPQQPPDREPARGRPGTRRGCGRGRPPRLVTEAAAAAAGGSPGLPQAEQDRRAASDLVRAEAAVVLGYSSPDAIEPDLAFNDLGFDSLTAVDLRNRLSVATGLRLPATLVFDYPGHPRRWRNTYGKRRSRPPRRRRPSSRNSTGSESSLSRSTPDDATFEMVTARLQACLAKWSRARRPSERSIPASDDGYSSSSTKSSEGGLRGAGWRTKRNCATT